jgi:hypothetical protein
MKSDVNTDRNKFVRVYSADILSPLAILKVIYFSIIKYPLEGLMYKQFSNADGAQMSPSTSLVNCGNIA